MTLYLNIIQILVSVALIVLLILQSKGGSLSRMFGAETSISRTRRGIEKFIFGATIVLAILFIAVSLAYFFI